jgi:hypothetical protein
MVGLGFRALKHLGKKSRWVNGVGIGVYKNLRVKRQAKKTLIQPL